MTFQDSGIASEAHLFFSALSLNNPPLRRLPKTDWERDNMTAAKSRTTFVSLAGAIFAVYGFAAHAQSVGPNLAKPGEIRYLKGRILVQPKAGLKVEELDRKLKAHGARRVAAIPRINVHVIELPPQANDRAVAALLKGDRHISFAEVDQMVPPAYTPNDPNFTRGWHLPKIGAPGAWDYSHGDGVTIAILDSGVDGTHPDLAGSMVPGYNAYDRNTDTRDVYGHGTLVAGAAAMMGNNLVGGTGVAFKSRIMPIRVTSLDGYGNWSAMANGIIWAADNGARVANLSFQQSCGSSTLWNAAQYMRSKGGVVTISAGNYGTLESMSPSDSITCVGATDSSDNKASWSSYGAFVDIAAPGVGIFTSARGGGYSSASGTSFSAPVTAAVYALMMSVNRTLTPSQLDAALFSAALDLGTFGKDAYYGHGRVDAQAAVAAVRTTTNVDSTAPAVSIASPLPDAKVNALVPVDVNASDDVGVTRVELYANGSLVGSDTTAPYGFSVDTSSMSDGELSLEARAVDAAGNMGKASVTVSIANDTTAPSVKIINPLSGATITGPTTVSATATDDKRVARVNLAINGKEVAISYGSSLRYSWDPYAGARNKRKRKLIAGSYTLTSTATDEAGNSRSTSISVTVQ